MEILIDRMRRDWWVLVVLAITVLGTVHRSDVGGYLRPNLWAGVLVVVAVVPLLWREVRPELTVVVNAAAVTTYFAASPGFPDGPIYLSVFLSTFAIASRRPARGWLPYAGGALVAILVALLLREARVDSSSDLGTAVRMLWFVTIDAASAALALAIRGRRETRSEQVRRTATEEQLRMAQDLHDGVGHGLAVIAMQAGVALHVLDQDPAAARRSLEAIRDTSRESLDALRAELVRLSPGPESAPRVPRNGLADLEVLASRIRAGGIRVDLGVDPAVAGGGLPPEVDAAGYVVVQEALTNVLRHAQADAAEVVVRRTPAALEITVTDDGRGAAGGAGGLGIPGMRTRVEGLGGTLDAGPAPGSGFRVRAVIPVAEVPA